jgi:hypothetical protein
VPGVTTARHWGGEGESWGHSPHPAASEEPQSRALMARAATPLPQMRSARSSPRAAAAFTAGETFAQRLAHLSASGSRAYRGDAGVLAHRCHATNPGSTIVSGPRWRGYFCPRDGNIGWICRGQGDITHPPRHAGQQGGRAQGHDRPDLRSGGWTRRSPQRAQRSFETLPPHLGPGGRGLGAPPRRRHSLMSPLHGP